jgi:Zn-dependent peptidase ImmA (M78 family)/DNA-binding XRE family transcriptional regulator
MSESQSELPVRVTQARRAAGFTEGDLAAKLGLDRAAVVALEAGTRRIDAVELAQIAETLRRPVWWFLGRWPASIVSRRRERDGLENASDIELELLASDVEQLVELELLEPAGFIEPAVTVSDVQGAEEAASAVRARLGLPAEPIVELVRAVEPLGLYAFVLELERGVEGSYLALRDCGVALVQGRDPVGKRRFTLAHELGHHVFQDEYSTEWVTGGRDERERLISAFAIHFLAPRAGVERRWRDLDGALEPWNAAVCVGAEYGLSWSALVPHLQNLGLISRSVRDELRRQAPGTVDFLERGLVIHELPAPPALPPGFVAAALKGYRRGLLGRERVLELLRGTLDASALRPPPDVPLWGMIQELEPL